MDDEAAFESGCEVSDAVRPEPMDVVPESVTRRRWTAAAKERIVAAPRLQHESRRHPAARGEAEIIVEVGDVRLRVPDGASADHVERVLLAVMVSA